MGRDLNENNKREKLMNCIGELSELLKDETSIRNKDDQHPYLKQV